jgi:hypothetical protein
MDDIKFKAWIEEYKKLVDVDCIDFAGKEIMKGFPSLTVKNEGGCILLEQAKLLQFIGNKDIKGYDIYVGFIVKASIKQRFKIDDGLIYNFKVVFENGCFDFELEMKYVTGYYTFKDLENIEIIGNYFENPELLQS